MPSWLKKRFQVLKRNLISHLVDAKQQKQALTNDRICDSNNERDTNYVKSPISKIRNDLRVNLNRIRIKTDMNAYRDYAEWRDQVLVNQNNCALRCIKEEKINNIDKINSLRTGASNQTDRESTLEHRNSNHHCNDDKAASGDVTIGDACRNCDCDSESEFMTAMQLLILNLTKNIKNI